MIKKIRYCCCIFVLMQVVTACSYVKSFFPDKERDYQFRTEIPELVIPDDIKAHSLSPKLPGAVSAANPVPNQALPDSKAQSLPETVIPKAPTELAKTDKSNQSNSETNSEAVVSQQPASSNAGISSLQIDQPQNQAWRLVARALSRQKIEIVERNLDKAYFYVKYDPDEIKPEDNNLWDEMAFLFGEDPSHEQEYRISLLGTGAQATEVTIQNAEGKTLSNSTATHLLKLITDGINLDLPTATPDEEQKNLPATESK